MLANDGFKIEIGMDVRIENHRRLANKIFGELVGARGAHRLWLDRVLYLDAKIGTVAKLVFDLLWLIRKRKRYVSYTGAAQRIDLVKQEKPATERPDWLGSINL